MKTLCGVAVIIVWILYFFGLFHLSLSIENGLETHMQSMNELGLSTHTHAWPMCGVDYMKWNNLFFSLERVIFFDLLAVLWQCRHTITHRQQASNNNCLDPKRKKERNSPKTDKVNFPRAQKSSSSPKSNRNSCIRVMFTPLVLATEKMPSQMAILRCLVCTHTTTAERVWFEHQSISRFSFSFFLREHQQHKQQ